MRTGKSIVELAQEIERQKEAAKDYTVMSTAMSMEVQDAKPKLKLNGREDRNLFFGVGPVAHDHLSTKLDIPKRYYDRMLNSNPELLSHNVNVWLKAEAAPEKRLVRTLDGTARAILSDRYRRIDNKMIAEAALPILMGMENLQVMSCELTERRMYIQVVTPKVQGEVKKGDVVQMGLLLSNSEVGCGSVRIEPLIFRLACLNGMVMSYAMKRHHVGRRIDIGFDGDEEGETIFRKETLITEDRAIFMKVQDTVRHAFNELAFQKELDTLRVAAGIPIETIQLEDSVKEVTKKYVLSKDEGAGILRNLITGGDLSKWGLANAVTSLANNPEIGYDRAVELERVGGEVINMNPADWKKVSRAGM